MTAPSTPTPATLDAADTRWSRPFRVVFPDGYVLHGVEFPSGRVVLDDIRTGLIGGYISIEHVALGPDDRIEWDEPHRLVCTATIDGLTIGDHVHRCDRTTDGDDAPAEHHCGVCGMTWGLIAPEVIPTT